MGATTSSYKIIITSFAIFLIYFRSGGGGGVHSYLSRKLAPFQENGMEYLLFLLSCQITFF